MSGVLARVSALIRDLRMFAQGSRVAVAVSGGADSVCLLHVLRELAPQWALRLQVVHIDHQLRGADSAADAAFTAELARAAGLPFTLREVDVGAAAQGDNLEQTAREVRRAVFRELRDGGTVDRVATGHTRSDQAETVLLRLLRGAGNTGLAGILPVTDEGVVRPLLDVDRDEVLAYLRGRGLPWREDASNRDLAFARNRVRHSLVPQLQEEWNPGLPAALARLATLARDEESYWQDEVARIAPSVLAKSGRAVVASAPGLAALPPALARRVARRALGIVRGDLRQLELAHVEGVLQLARAPVGHGRVQVPGVDVLRSFEWLRFSPGREGEPSWRWVDLVVPIPGRACLSATGPCISLQAGELSTDSAGRETKKGYNEGGNSLDWDELGGVLRLRCWQPGDRYVVAGADRPKRLKLLFQEERVPLWDRCSWPILTDNGRIAWTRRFGAAAWCRATPGTRRILRVEERHGPVLSESNASFPTSHEEGGVQARQDGLACLTPRVRRGNELER